MKMNFFLFGWDMCQRKKTFKFGKDLDHIQDANYSDFSTSSVFHESVGENTVCVSSTALVGGGPAV